MDAKFLSNKPLRSIAPSGRALLLLVSTSLLLGSIVLDAVAGRLGELQSLTSPLVCVWGMTAIAGFLALPILRALKTGQFIREEGPKAHLKKAGTPTMGGVFFVPLGVVFAIAFSGFSPLVMATSFLTLAYGFIGWLDDWQVLRRKSNKGISPRMKLVLQISFAIAFCLWVMLTQPVTVTQLSLPFGLMLPLGILFWPLAGFVLVAESNATNLTDGLDGLLGGTAAIALLGLGALIAPTHPELMVFCGAMSGACLGFLVHNSNPAKVFMGDTGSLALGGALAAVGILSGNLFGLLIVTLLFFAETLSVIIQVTYYKVTKGPDGVGKRFFRMAPLHHHFELSGWSELQVVGAFYGITALLAAIAISIL
ncbi:phospho-N-acetylmuramoyl-pentapeptide-transferase [Oscillatoria sp. CS-180]|uniref:phospho-N-acetylmuramoyl-pentapeptide- transferase n=1 Tax=Oscillatoria sp. CS-180 TaxID=3021720 RepID=UPI00232BF22A|nr:phospho-N-acetylmuramoyl-pentapeptide-transferase [Oscillatoria sp. CS-180]MDB9524415.1 phospho-N-acetylmuramoyl-pentapeptide-transferase [Oscillatoria sp. CS-180]